LGFFYPNTSGQLAIAIPFFGICGIGFYYISTLVNHSNAGFITLAIIQVLCLMMELIYLWSNYRASGLSHHWLLFGFYIEISGILLTITIMNVTLSKYFKDL
jgi:hypothetical protein